MRYRPDIDGLRALAVLPVILFHAGASWLPGGFVGVDIFFVISGYLISSIILREMQTGDFSFRRFYERRLRRILPALLLVVLVTVAAFHIVALPGEARRVAESGVAAVLSFANFHFWRSTGYFAPSAEFMPLLHTWSLSVEEQFYLLFPIGLLAVLRLGLPLKWTLAICTVVAFGVGVWLSGNARTIAYFLLPARVWELGIGAALAAGVLPPLRYGPLRQAVPAIGTAVILFSFFYISGDMPFPGWVALMPCLGAASILYAGHQSWVGNRLLASRPMVLIGLLSYSLYLWHWPLLAFVRTFTASPQIEPAAAFAVIIATFALSWLTWRYVEKPFRKQAVMPPRLAFGLIGAGAVAVMGGAVLSVWTDGFAARLTEPARAALAAAQDMDPLFEACRAFERQAECRFGDPNAPVTYAVVGDSHAMALRAAVEASGLIDGAAIVFWAPACPMLDGARLVEPSGRTAYFISGIDCVEFKKRVWKTLDENKNLRIIILGGRWPLQLMGTMPEGGGSKRFWLVDDETELPSQAESERVLARSLARTLDRSAAHGLRVIVLGSIPEPGIDVPKTVALARQSERATLRIPRTEVEERAGRADAVISAVASGRRGVTFVSILSAFCGPQWCDIDQDGVPLYSDDDHVSVAGAIRVVAPVISQALMADSPRQAEDEGTR